MEFKYMEILTPPNQCSGPVSMSLGRSYQKRNQSFSVITSSDTQAMKVSPSVPQYDQEYSIHLQHIK